MNLFFIDYNISQILHNIQCPESNKKMSVQGKGENMIHNQE